MLKRLQKKYEPVACTRESLKNHKDGLCIKVLDHDIAKDDLAPTLQYLNLGTIYNKKLLKDALPAGLKYLIFSPKYNKKIFFAELPQELIFIMFSRFFRQRIHVLPPKLKYIVFMPNYKTTLSSSVLPNTVVMIHNLFHAEGKLPASLKKLNLSDHATKLPVMCEGVKKLYIGKKFTRTLNSKDLPSTITHLTFKSYQKKIPVGVLPVSLTHLIFENKFSTDNLPDDISESVVIMINKKRVKV